MARGNSSRAASEAGPLASTASQDALVSKIPVNADYDHLLSFKDERDAGVTNFKELEAHAQEYMQLALEGNYDVDKPKDVELQDRFEKLTQELREDLYDGVGRPKSKIQTTIARADGAPDIEMKWHLEMDYVDTNKWEPSFHLESIKILT
jgi:hypothetical protein